MASLRRYAILDTPPDPALDAIARLAAAVCATPTAIITLIDEHRQWLKSTVGSLPQELARDVSFCTHAMHPPRMLVVPDATADPRFVTNPLVTCDGGIRFYAGAPLLTPTGEALGTLAVIDVVPRTLTPGQQEALVTLAANVMAHLERRRQSLETTLAERALRNTLRERQVTEQSLRSSESRYRMLFARNPAPMWVYDTVSLQFLAVNAAAVEHYGYSESEFLSMRLSDIRESTDIPVLSAAIADVRRGGRRQTTVTRHRKLDGTLIDVEVTGDDIVFDGRDARLILVQDITARRAAEQRISEQAALLDEAQDAIMLTDLEHRILFWNRGAERLYGWNAVEAIGSTVGALHHPDSVSRDEALRCLLQHGRWEGALPQRNRRGEAITVESRWALTRDAVGAPKSILVFNTDVTERKRTEAQRLRAQRMESIGTLAGGIAHDLNNLLAPMMMSVGLLRELTHDESQADLLRTVEVSAARGAQLVQQLLQFARGVEGERVPVSPALLVGELHRIVRDSFPKSIRTTVRCADGARSVYGDPTQLHQVLLNLCVNARDAMIGGGELHVSVDNVTVDETQAALLPEATPGEFVVIRVRDNGHGIAPDVRERIFEPFFSTKEMGKGTGLGLSTSLAIVRSHGGFISLYSDPGAGSAFHVYLPALGGDVPAASAPTAAAPLPAGSGELVLIVDDEEAIRRIAQRTLERFNYRVITAEQGVEAIALFEAHRGEIALVLTDMAMPVMDGNALIAALRALDPGIPIVGSSGLASSEGIERVVGGPPVHFVAKPYTADMLLSAVRAALTPTAGRDGPR